jgi:hypothetical protein
VDTTDVPEEPLSRSQGIRSRPVEGKHGCRGEDGRLTARRRPVPTGTSASTRTCHFAAKVVVLASPDKIAATIKSSTSQPGWKRAPSVRFLALLPCMDPWCVPVSPDEKEVHALTCPVSLEGDLFQHASARRGDERRRQHRALLSACRPQDKIRHRISNPGLKWLSIGGRANMFLAGPGSARVIGKASRHSTTFSAYKDLKHGNVLALRARGCVNWMDVMCRCANYFS